MNDDEQDLSDAQWAKKALEERQFREECDDFDRNFRQFLMDWSTGKLGDI